MKSINRILIIEDDFSLAENLCRTFTDIDGETMAYSCGSVTAAKDMMYQENFDIIIINAGLTDGKVSDFVKEVEVGKFRQSDTKVIMMVSDRDMLEAVWKCEEEYRADDYITKPFSMTVLKAKVGTQIRKKKRGFNYTTVETERFSAVGGVLKSHAVEDEKIIIDDYIFDFERSQFSRNGEIIILEAIEKRLLRILLDNRGVVLKRKALMDKLYLNKPGGNDDNRLPELIDSLTKKLRAECYIKTVFGIGYLWDNKKS